MSYNVNMFMILLTQRTKKSIKEVEFFQLLLYFFEK